MIIRPSTRIPLRLRAAALSALLAVPVAACFAGEEYTFINIADNTGSLGNSFSNPAINAHGRVVFGASIGGGNTGIFTGDGGPLTTIVLGGDGNFNVSSFVDINDSGDVCMRVSENILEEGIYIGNGGQLSLVVFSDETPFQSVGLPNINASGQVSFFGIDTNGTDGIHRAQGLGNYTTIADESGAFVSFSGRSVVNDSGRVAFYGATNALGGIYTGEGGALTTIAESVGEFSFVSNVVSMNNQGSVAFVAGTVAEQGVYVGNGGPLTLIADSDGAYALFNFNDACINNEGDVAFIALPDNGPKGIFTGPDPVADAVIQVGDPLFGGTIIGFSALIGPGAINDDGDIAFVYFLDDARIGVAVANAMGGASPPGDLNNDQIVDVSDLLILLGAWGPCPNPCPPSCAADINEDCNVDVTDLLTLLANWS